MSTILPGLPPRTHSLVTDKTPWDTFREQIHAKLGDNDKES